MPSASLTVLCSGPDTGRGPDPQGAEIHPPNRGMAGKRFVGCFKQNYCRNPEKKVSRKCILGHLAGQNCSPPQGGRSRSPPATPSRSPSPPPPERPGHSHSARQRYSAAHAPAASHSLAKNRLRSTPWVAWATTSCSASARGFFLRTRGDPPNHTPTPLAPAGGGSILGQILFQKYFDQTFKKNLDEKNFGASQNRGKPPPPGYPLGGGGGGQLPWAHKLKKKISDLHAALVEALRRQGCDGLL